MLTLQRYGMTTASTYGIIVNLTAEYTGNQLKYISDGGADIAMDASMDFKEYTKGTNTEYFYNRNGAMYKDLNKGISQIRYNSLNLPQTVDIKNKNAEGRNEYTYSASGQKLKVVQRWNPDYYSAPVIGSDINVISLTNSTTTDYINNIIYENGNLKRILVDGGYYEGGNYYFYVNDHLGNNRIVANAAASVVQSTQYYPFGMPFADATGVNVQPYKYNNKELDGRNGLNWYDNGARPYNSPFPNTPTVDPHAENYYSWSPYAWVGNNPMRVIDPLGTDTVHVNPDGTAQRYADGTVVSNPGEGYALIQDKPLLTDEKGTPQVVIEADVPVKGATDYVGYQLTVVAATPLIGYTAQGGIGIIGEDGVFLNGGLGSALGWDFSISLTTVTGKYKGDGKPSASSLKGKATSGNLGVGLLTGGYSEDLTKVKTENGIREYSGQNWTTFSRGVTLGSKTFVGGNVSTITTLSPLYLYKK